MRVARHSMLPRLLGCLTALVLSLGAAQSATTQEPNGPAGGGWRVLAGDRTTPGQFWAPRGVAVDGAGNLYVADTKNQRIQKLSPDGEPLAQWGSAGSAPGQFRNPSGVAVDGAGNLYVADTENNRVQVLWLAGQPELGAGAR